MADNIQHTGATVSEADADRQTEAIKTVMAERKLDYGPALDLCIRARVACIWKDCTYPTCIGERCPD